jgi:hypothetical protein
LQWAQQQRHLQNQFSSSLLTELYLW